MYMDAVKEMTLHVKNYLFLILVLEDGLTLVLSSRLSQRRERSRAQAGEKLD